MFLKFPWSPAGLITVVALFVTIAYNQTLFAELHSRLNALPWDAGGFVVTLFAVMLALLGKKPVNASLYPSSCTHYCGD